MKAINYFAWALQLALIVLKLCQVIDWRWRYVLAWILFNAFLMMLWAFLTILGKFFDWLAWKAMTPEDRARAQLLQKLRELQARYRL